MDHQELQETFEWPVWKMFWWIYAFLVLAIAGVMVPLGLFIGILTGDLLGGLMIPAIFLTPVIPFGVIFAGLIAIKLAMIRPTTSVKDGDICVRFGDTAERVHPLSECEWHAGKLSDARIGNIPLPPSAAIIIALPRVDGEDETTNIAVGGTEQMRHRWRAFLTLAGVPQRSPWTEPSWLRVALDVAVMLLSFPVCFVGGMLVAAFVTAILSSALGPAWHDVAEAIGFFLFLPGVLSALVYIWVLWPYASGRRVPTKMPLREQRSQALKTRFQMLFVSLVLGVPVVLGGVFDTPRADWTYFFLCLAWGGIFGWHLARLVTPYDWETARPSDKNVETTP